MHFRLESFELDYSELEYHTYPEKHPELLGTIYTGKLVAVLLIVVTTTTIKTLEKIKPTDPL